MRILSIIILCAVVLIAAIAVPSQATNAPAKPEASNAVKCWSFADADVFFRSVAADDKAAYVSTDKGSVIAVGAANGERLWRAEFGGEVVSNIAVGPDRIAIATRPADSSDTAKTATLRVLSKETGILVWKAEIDGAGEIFLKTAPDTIVAAASSGEVSAFDLRAETLKWKLTFAGGLSTAPVLDDTLLAFATGDSRLVGVTLAGGESRFSIGLKRPAKTVVFDDNEIYAGDSRGEVVRLEAADGYDAKWKYRAGAQIGRLMENDGELLAASFDNFLYSIDRASGRVNWKLRLPARVLGAATMDSKRLFVLVENGKIAMVVSAETGRIDSQVDLGEAPIATAADGSHTFVLSPVSLAAYGSGTCAK
ncbi:MAG TPA: PQQ-binding-like beta-propeller repeat protein [Pyrinomonadaceae bacterium]|nr:PQQ-binding-like beta-propeller repeat protein [Pyrinomonadaceae bacterium]